MSGETRANAGVPSNDWMLAAAFDVLGVAKGPLRVVEIGCGTGKLAHWLAGWIGSEGSVEAFDIDRELVERASADGAGRANIRFAVGDVHELPVPPQSADLVICRSLLCVLKDPATAVSRMVKLLKPGGELVAIEPATEQSVLDPDDARFTQQSQHLMRAFHQGWLARQADPKIGLRVAGLFLDAGLVHLRAEAVAQVHLLSDGRRSVRHVLDQLVTEAADLPIPTREMLQRGGFSAKEQRDIQGRAADRASSFADDVERIRRSGYVRLMSTQIVTVGRVPI